MNNIPEEHQWVQTYNGIKFFPFNPNIDDILLDDIAWHLSMTVRYNKAVKKYYSVAEHCVLLTKKLYHDIFEKEYVFSLSSKLQNINTLLLMLHHDDGEAYLNDIATPIKPYFQELIKAEEVLMNLITIKFDIIFDNERDDRIEYIREKIKWYDHSIVADEKSQVLKDYLNWPLLKHKGLGIKLKFWKQKKAYKQFLKWHWKLIEMRNKEYLK